MAVKLRLMRMGKKKQPTYRIVAADSRSPRDGRFIEIFGTYQPRADPSVIPIDAVKAAKWLADGAQPTERVAKLLKESGALAAGAELHVSTEAVGRGGRQGPRRHGPRRARVRGQEHRRRARCSVEIDMDEGRRGDVRLSLRVATEDMGKVIGRRGRVAQAIRAVVRAAGAREGHRGRRRHRRLAIWRAGKMDGPVLLEVGRIVKPHGLRGEVVVALVTNRPERLAVGSTLHAPTGTRAWSCQARPFEATGDGRWIVSFEGVRVAKAADALRGTVAGAAAR